MEGWVYNMLKQSGQNDRQEKLEGASVQDVKRKR